MNFKVIFPEPCCHFDETSVTILLKDLINLMYTKDVLDVVRKNLKVPEGVSILEFTSMGPARG